ncbi:hypothetical protein [Kribbia dieselivorans]|uniref:hypothetical protein n=1 Tax=Kribbia dieselivorans TaxID=331526 RepID=UPI0012EE3330|nr:hypothetical protein [Kribbia dieselivorans]
MSGTLTHPFETIVPVIRADLMPCRKVPLETGREERSTHRDEVQLSEMVAPDGQKYDCNLPDRRSQNDWLHVSR